MKKYLYLIIFMLGLVSCHMDDIDLYHSQNYISFENREQDTLIVSFFLLGNLTEYNCPIGVRYTGIPTSDGQEFSIAAVDSLTSVDKKYYTLPIPEFTAMSHLDTIYVKLINYPDLQTSSVTLCLELNANENFQLGDRDYRRIHLIINDNVAKPDWWNSNVVDYSLGAYSEAKFRKLVEIAKPDLQEINDSWIRVWALKLKAHLDQMTAEGTPVTEKNGDKMTVPVKM